MKSEFFVIDTNNPVSAFLFEYSTPKLAFDNANRLGNLAANIETYDEFCHVFMRPKFDKYISLETRLKIINELEGLLVFRKVSEKIEVCRDPKDNKFLELAISANASCLITGDKDLLVLHPFRGVPILNAVDFINNF